ncbi:uncharacterized protein DDB_G0283357-like isoform X2 [Lucilia cuprina]|uniref:uncharacterized protein DDB_G0283357-like isoform X2 n=1 Tax=Lucilia cuprina TaxID=7375 RepID=UPI001F0654F9|nr:uncharacterized protein DDB_G0283357-like isoform X2 [Lucilia cuprina]
MGTTAEMIVNKTKNITNNENATKTNDPILETSKPETAPHNNTTITSIAEITTAASTTTTITTTNNTTTHITNTENETECTAAQNIKSLPKASPPPQVIIIPANSEASTAATNAAKKIRRAFSMPRNPFRWSHKLKTTTADHKTNGRVTQDSGGGEVKGGGSSGLTGFSSITKSYTLSSCVGGKRERAESFVSLNSNDDNYIPTTNTNNKETQQTQAEENEKSKASIAKSSTTTTKKFNTKSNTINGVSSLTNSSTLATGASLFSTLPAGASNSGNSNSANNNNRVFRRSSFRKFLNRITQHMTASSKEVKAGSKV